MKPGPDSINKAAKTTFLSSKMASNSFRGCPSRGSESQVAKKTVLGTKKNTTNGHLLGSHFGPRIEKRHSKRHTKFNAEKVLKFYAKRLPKLNRN